MHVHPENLKRGMFIATVTKLEDPEPVNPETFSFSSLMWGQPSTGSSHQYNGHPYEVMAIDFPFLACRRVSDNKVVTLDLRVYKVKRLSRTYVEALSGVKPPPSATAKAKKKKKEKPDPRNCPRCGGTVIQRIPGNQPIDWRKVCTNCGVDLGPVTIVKT